MSKISYISQAVCAVDYLSRVVFEETLNPSYFYFNKGELIWAL